MGQRQRKKRANAIAGNAARPAASPTAALIPKSVFSRYASPWVSLSLVAAVLFIYAPVRRFDFLRWDDPLYIGENPQVLGGLTWHGVWWALTTGHAPYWHPLTWLSHMLDVQIYGMNAGGHHFTSVLIHAVNAVLLFWLLRWTTGALGRSAFVGALFAVHPLRVESVAWVAERKDVLSTLFWILTLCAYVWYVRQPRLSRYLAVVGGFALALMSKPMVVTLPFVLLLLDFWPLRRAKLYDDARVWLSLAKEKIPLLALAAATSVATFILQRQAGAVVALDSVPVTGRLANALVSYLAYVGKMLWPVRLAAFYPYSTSLNPWWVAGAVVALIGVSMAVIRASRVHPYLPVGWFWYLGTLLPVIGFFQAGDQALADRFVYIPLIGLFLMIAWGIPDLLSRWRYSRAALSAAAIMVLFACTLRARDQVQYWQNALVLWTHALEVTDDNHMARDGLGTALVDRGRVAEAVAHYSEAVRIKPQFAEAQNNLAWALAHEGRIEEAMPHYLQALRIKPEFADAQNNLAWALTNEGRIEEALPHYAEALRLKPEFADAHNNLGIALASEGKTESAMSHFSEAIRIDPKLATAHNNLGTALANQGRTAEAIQHFTEALRIDPTLQAARRALDALKGQGISGPQ